jgi:hypothetical protein
VEPAVAEKFADQYPQPELLFNISYLVDGQRSKTRSMAQWRLAEVAEGKKVK